MVRQGREMERLHCSIVGISAIAVFDKLDPGRLEDLIVSGFQGSVPMSDLFSEISSTRAGKL